MDRVDTTAIVKPTIVQEVNESKLMRDRQVVASFLSSCRRWLSELRIRMLLLLWRHGLQVVIELHCWTSCKCYIVVVMIRGNSRLRLGITQGESEFVGQKAGNNEVSNLCRFVDVLKESDEGAISEKNISYQWLVNWVGRKHWARVVN